MRRWITAGRRPVFSRALLRARGLLVLASAAAGVMLAPAAAGASRYAISVRLTRASRAVWHTTATPGVLYVDRGSVGGRCDDTRPVTAVTVTTPWCTLGRAIAAAPAGSTVYVRQGSYPLLQVSSFVRSSTVTFAAYPGEQPVLAGVSLGSPMTAWAAPPSVQNLALSGFRITNPGVSLQNFSGVTLSHNEIALTPVPPTHCLGGSTFNASSCIVNTPTAVKLNIPASNLTISDNYIHDGWMGVTMRNGSPPGLGNPPSATYRNVTITQNKFEHMGGVVLQIENFQNVTVSHNEFADDVLRSDIDPYCHCEAMHVIGGGDQLMIDSNMIYGGRGISVQPARPDNTNCNPICLKVTGATIQNNLMAGTQFGLWVQSVPGIKILNNTIWGTEAYRDELGLRFYSVLPATTGVVLANNLIRNLDVESGVSFAVEDYNEIAAYTVGPGLITPKGPHDITASPLFVDPTDPNWNFQLAPGSPGLAAGSATYAPSTDMVGTLRPNPPSMGAYEPTGTTPPNPPGPRAGAAGAGTPSGSGSGSGSSSGTRPAPTVSARGSATQSTSHGRVTVRTRVLVRCPAAGPACPLAISVRRAPSASPGARNARRWSRQVAVLHRRRSVPAAGGRWVQLRFSVRLLDRLLGRGHTARLQLVIAVSDAGGRREFKRVLRLHAPRRARRAAGRHGSRHNRGRRGWTG